MASALKALKNEQHRRFVEALFTSPNRTQAAIKAGYSAKSARWIAYDIMGRADVQAAVEELRDKAAAKIEMTSEAVIKRWWEIATADPRELIEYHQNACRHCWGDDFAYQWRDIREFAEACQVARDREKKEPDDAGGYGYSHDLPPNPECSRCNGSGIGRTVIADTRDISPQAALLYAGVKETAQGIEVRMNDQVKALENVAKIMGMFKEQVEHNHNVSFVIERTGRSKGGGA